LLLTPPHTGEGSRSRRQQQPQQQQQEAGLAPAAAPAAAGTEDEDEETKQERGAAATAAATMTTTTGKQQQQQQQQEAPQAQAVAEAEEPMPPPPPQGADAAAAASASSPFRPAGATSLPMDPHDLLLSVEIDDMQHHQHHLPMPPHGDASTAAAAGSYVPLSDLRFPYYPEALLSTQAMASTSSLEGASVHSLSLDPAPSLTSLADTSSVGDMSDMASLSLRDPLDVTSGGGGGGGGRLFYGRDGAPLYSQVSGWG
jgi:hypothetical protein